MNINLTLTSILIFTFSLLPAQVHAAANTYYVTQNGNGARSGESLGNAWSVSNFNSSTNWSNTDSGTKIAPGDTVYFFGRITTKVKPPTGYGGSPGNYITLDGYKAGNCNHMSGDIDANAALIDTSTGYGIELNDNHYLIIQDFGITDIDTAAIGSITTSSDNAIGNITFRRIGITEAMDGIRLTTNSVSWTGGTYITIEDCLIKNIASGDTSSARGHIRLLAVNDLIIRRNYIYNDGTVPLVGNGQDGMVILSSSRVLIEYNKVHHMSEDCIDFKDDADAVFGDVIIRFNYLSDTRQSPITLQDVNGSNAYVYGNLIDGNSAGGVRWGGIYIFRGFEKVAAWANVIYDTDKSGIIMFDQDGARQVDNGFFSNNTIVNNRIDSTSYQHAGIAMWNRRRGTYVAKNNILVDNAANDSDRGQIYVGSGVGNYTTVDYNLYWLSHGGNTAKIYWNASSGSDYYELADPVSGTTFYSSTGKERHGKVLDPLFTDLDRRDLTLTSNSPAINSGETLSSPAWWSIPTIQGVDYSTEVMLSVGLDPINTNWKTTPPTVRTTRQGNYGSWDRGAYVYTGDSSSPGISPPIQLKIKTSN